MLQNLLHKLDIIQGQKLWQLVKIFMIVGLIIAQIITLAEGTKQLEPANSKPNSVCRLALTNEMTQHRIPFALLGCAEEYRLNIRVTDFRTERIYIGFGDVNPYDKTEVLKDVRFQLKDPYGNILPDYSLDSVPYSSGNKGYIEDSTEAYEGPNINNTNPKGYYPLEVIPYSNGDYILEFTIPYLNQSEARVFRFFDVTVANGNIPVEGRLWSKAWQLSSSSVRALTFNSNALFHIYSNDSIVTRFDCNGMAGGIWAIYSNEWGCATTGIWSTRRKSTIGNATVRPEYKIFLNDPDSLVFPSGQIGEMLSFKVQPQNCDTAIYFSTEVTKAGNIEIILDVPPFNPGFVANEDVQLGYPVNAGYNLLLPGWDGKNSAGVFLNNGTQVQVRISFLNGLTNIPLYDVEDNPNGFKVNIERPIPISGDTKLKIYWDDSGLPSLYQPMVNDIYGCLYTNILPVSGCHEWSNIDNRSLGDVNTVNSWWYYPSGNTMVIPITLNFKPTAGNIIAPANVCEGQLVTFQTLSIHFAEQYVWRISGPGISAESEKDAPDTTFLQQIYTSMSQGLYTVSVFGRNQKCGDGDTLYHSFYVHAEPQASFAYEIPCQGAGITFTDHSKPADAVLTQFTWNVKSETGDNQTYHGNPAMLYFNSVVNYTVTLIIKDALGCIDSVSSMITIKPKPDCAFDFVEIEGKDRGQLQFQNKTNGATSYFWDFGNTFTSTLTEPQTRYTMEGDYTILLVATSMDGCLDSAIKQYYYTPGLWLPDAFTPDNNGTNDVFKPVTLRNTLEPYLLQIYNRWGQLIFTSSIPREGWDGRYKGDECPVGIYRYLVKFRENARENSGTIIQKGAISLIR